jgi:DNA repair photolyase
LNYETQRCRTGLSRSRLPDLLYSLNPYFGCEHGCIYCYSPSVFRNEVIARNWGEFVKAKNNIPEVLTKEIPGIEIGTVGVSTVTDPYQQAESHFELTKRCLEILSTNRFPVSIQTKSNLVLRDIEIIRPAGFEVGVTLTTLNNDIARKIEPHASAPDSRVHVLEEFHSRGVRTWIFFGPIIPEINDDSENVGAIVRVAKKTNSRILYDKLNIKNWVIERMTPTLEQLKPELIKRIPELVEANSNWWKTITSTLRARCKEESVMVQAAFQ